MFHIGLPLQAERREYCLHLLHASSVSANIDPQLDCNKLADDVAAKTNGFTPAYLKESFTGAALQCAHNGVMQLNEQFVEALFSQIAVLRAHLQRSKNTEKLGEMDIDDDRIGLRSR